MINQPTMLIIGAGASAEFGMPVGTQLLQKISELVAFDPSRPDFSQSISDSFGPERVAELDKFGPELIKLIPRFNSIDEVLNFVSDNPPAIELGKLAIAYEILMAERQTCMFKAEAGDESAVSECDATWAGHFLRMAIGATRRTDFAKFFRNLTVIDFNYDRVFPQYLYSALIRLYGLSAHQAEQSLAGLDIFHPYGCLGPLPWQADRAQLPLGAYVGNTLAEIVKRIRTYTEERTDPQFERITKAVNDARVAIILGFGFHGQNIELLGNTRGAQVQMPVFMTARVGHHYNESAAAQNIKLAFNTAIDPIYLPSIAKNFWIEIGKTIELAVSSH
jgi:hypothetical protein